MENDENIKGKPRKRDTKDIKDFNDLGDVINDALKDVFEQFSLDKDSFLKDLFNPDNRTRRGRGFGNAWGFGLRRGPNGKVNFRQFGNPPFKGQFAPIPDGERSPFFDIVDDDDDNLKVIVEVPGVTKENLSIKATDRFVVIKTREEFTDRKYDIKIPFDAPVDPKSAKAVVKNGILSITFKKQFSVNGIPVEVE